MILDEAENYFFSLLLSNRNPHPELTITRSNIFID